MIDPNQMGPGGPPPPAMMDPSMGAPPGMAPPGGPPPEMMQGAPMPPDLSTLDPDAAIMAIGEILAALGIKAKMQDQAMDMMSQIIEAARGGGGVPETLDMPAGTESQALTPPIDEAAMMEGAPPGMETNAMQGMGGAY